MSALIRNLNYTVAALVAVVMYSLPAGPAMAADKAKLDQLFAQLQEAGPTDAERIAKEIELEYSKSGSASADLLFKRGRDALESGQTRRAIEHLTALTDHAPGFSEGWYLRALAYLQADMIGPALADLERTLALAPRHFGAIEALGYLLEEINQPDMALEAYERVIDIHPHHKDVSAALDRLGPQVGGRDL